MLSYRIFTIRANSRWTRSASSSSDLEPAAGDEHEGDGEIGRDVARMMAELTAAGSSSSSGLNAIDACWRSDGGWASNRKKLADCAIGFGSGTTGGKAGNYYVVTNSGDDATNPAPGTLRYGVIQEVPLWIYFARSMTIVLANELIITSDKTIDGRGASVEIAHGPCLTIQGVYNVIVHGLSIHDCKPGKPGRVRSSVSHVRFRRGSDGDAISVLASRNVWIDHNAFASCDDGLVDVIRASTAVTISNNYFAYHDKVMLLGASDTFTADRNMKVSIVFNHFGPGLVKRMPR
jgi:pectate lyase